MERIPDLKHLQVLIIGAGPTGLTLACELARRNVSVRIIDRAAEYPEQLSPLFGRTRGIYVVRPDGYIGLIMGVGDEAVVHDYLSKFLLPGSWS